MIIYTFYESLLNLRQSRGANKPTDVYFLRKSSFNGKNDEKTHKKIIDLFINYIYTRKLKGHG